MMTDEARVQALLYGRPRSRVVWSSDRPVYALPVKPVARVNLTYARTVDPAGVARIEEARRGR